MLLRLGISAALAMVLVGAAMWLGRGLLPERPLPVRELGTLELVEPLDSERQAAQTLREFLAVAPSRRFRESASRSDLRPLQVGPAPGAEARAIPGTVVPPVSRERAELFDRARNYARAYNLLVERAALGSSSSSSAARSPERTAPSGEGASR